MSELAYRPMTLEEFLRWDDGTETHYELIGGFPVAMAPPAAAHRSTCRRNNVPLVDSRPARRWLLLSHPHSKCCGSDS